MAHYDVGLYTGFYEKAWHGFDAYRTMRDRLSAIRVIEKNGGARIAGAAFRTVS
ncbi:MAG TPA: hypothetical protein VHX17_02800 [Candidatus Cybelea sp.]|nr:hypothetical protein [Candidatus Cybelea sp.]